MLLHSLLLSSTVPWFQRATAYLCVCWSQGSPGSFGWGRLQPLGSAPGRTAGLAYRSAPLGMTSPHLSLNVIILIKQLEVSITTRPFSLQKHKNKELLNIHWLCLLFGIVIPNWEPEWELVVLEIQCRVDTFFLIILFHPLFSLLLPYFNFVLLPYNLYLFLLSLSPHLSSWQCIADTKVFFVVKKTSLILFNSSGAAWKCWLAIKPPPLLQINLFMKPIKWREGGMSLSYILFWVEGVRLHPEI